MIFSTLSLSSYLVLFQIYFLMRSSGLYNLLLLLCLLFGYILVLFFGNRVRILVFPAFVRLLFFSGLWLRTLYIISSYLVLLYLTRLSLYHRQLLNCLFFSPFMFIPVTFHVSFLNISSSTRLNNIENNGLPVWLVNWF